MRKKARAVDRWLSAGLDLLYPTHCVGCGNRGAVWCDQCDRQLDRLRPPLCPDCGLGLGRAKSCRSCRRRRPGLPVRSYARYSGRLVPALLHLKYRPDRRLAQRMGRWLASLARREGWAATAVVPVPLGSKRLRRRGFNQAELLGAQLARTLRLPQHTGRLRRVEETRSQVGLTPSERWENVRHAFRARPESLARESILLVDDLMTTGATLSACAAALRAAGAEAVWGLTVGRA